MDSTSIGDVAFLTRSEHRAVVLGELADGPRTRREIHDTTGISQPTLGRILGGFEERGWAAKNGSEIGREYALTPLGELIIDEFTSLLDTAATVRELRSVVEQLPFDEMDFDRSLLRKTSITSATPDDPLAHMRRQNELAEDAEHVRTLCSAFSPRAVEAQQDRMLNGVNTGEAIIETGALGKLDDHPELAQAMAELVDLGQLILYAYDGTVPLMLDLFDDTVGIVPLDDDGMPAGTFIESDNPRISTWARDLFESYKKQANSLEPAELRP